MNKTTEKTVLERKTADLGVAGVAAVLGVNSAHISNVVSTGERDVGPTLRRAMIAAGWIPRPDPYPYFKIRRDDPAIAAKQIVDRVARNDLDARWLNLFVFKLYELADAFNPKQNDTRNFYIGVVGHAQPVIIPAADTNKQPD